MAASLLPLLLFLFLITVNNLSAAQTTLSHGGFFLDITKDVQTHQYTTQLLIGTPQLPTKLVVHLSGESLWLNCAQSSSSRQFVRHGSLPCLMAKSGAQTPIPPSPTICNVRQENPITGSTNLGDLAEDILTVFDNMGSPATVDRFIFSCSPEYLLQNLASSAKGMLSFGRSKIAFQSQAVNNFNIPRKFVLCLSSSNGFIISGIDISKSLSYTPLISSHGHQDGYYVNVKAIKINGRKLVLQPIRGVEISTVVPYTIMKSSIYGIFTKAYVKAAASMNMTMVAPVAPFGVCFSSQQGKVPEIELVLQSELVKWMIQRRNLMVQVSDLIMCLGFVDGGLSMSGSVVLGGYQLEDHILEFNVGTGMLGFSSSLLTKGNSCSSMKTALVSTPTESL
ncbi:unnamed protein product [Lactuca saligna]|uniref:Peptidase A1 domain-containing protein n=1 Tax=Lactuca saligna TaxID=75948 RepID=A0AA35ZWP7_LACSI|nr:unnamed protein product [Lactuca saligna]